MSSVKHAVIAVAGLGSRLGMGKPKCLIEIGGKTILERQLALVTQIENVRLVVGFEEQAVIELARSLRSDVTIVRNPAYRTTSTLHSYLLGASFIKDECLFLDGDIIFEKNSFFDFISKCKPGLPLVAITESKTKDAVYTELDVHSRIANFTRTEVMDFEWANMVWIKPEIFKNPEGTVFERLMTILPLQSCKISSYEVDTVEDMQIASKFVLSLESENVSP